MWDKTVPALMKHLSTGRFNIHGCERNFYRKLSILRQNEPLVDKRVTNHRPEGLAQSDIDHIEEALKRDPEMNATEN